MCFVEPVNSDRVTVLTVRVVLRGDGVAMCHRIAAQ